MFDAKGWRRHLFVDPIVQSTLVVRVVFYWALCLFGIILMLLCWRIISGPAISFHGYIMDMWDHFGPALIASLVLLPLVLVDILRLSNRFVGPLLRLRRSLRQLARGEYVEPLELRGSDFWREIADEFNAVRIRVLASSSRSSKHEDEEEPAAIG